MKDKNLLQLISFAIGLILFTVFICYLFIGAYKKLEELNTHVKVEWKNNNNFILTDSPNWFLHDRDSLQTLKQINDVDKFLLMNLVEKDTSKSYNSYVHAINKLSFLSNSNSKIPFSLLLYIGGLSAVIGVQIRTLHDFIGQTCYKKNIDLKVWWPWYVVRPFLGFLVGGVVIVFMEASILKSSLNYNSSNFLFIGFTVLAGFGSTDVVSLLRTLSKKIFGRDTTTKNATD